MAAISIQSLTNQGLFGRANDAKRESEIANIKEQIALDIYEKQLEPPVGSITEDQLKTILEKQGTIIYEEDGVTIKGITTDKGYEILLKDIYGGETVAEAVPDGATVTPVNDITTWLKTGKISKQYSYTTIEQVIADSTCTESLMNNENAMKYLARSTEFADAICESQTAMTYLGESAYVDDTALNSDLWLQKICNSTYFEKVLNIKVPTMTSNTAPSGECFASSYQTGYEAYKAFSSGNTFAGKTYWDIVQNTSSPYVYYKFTIPTSIKLFHFYNCNQDYYNNLNYEIDYSDNGTTWSNAYSGNTGSDASLLRRGIIGNTEPHLYWRLKYNSIGSHGYIATANLQFYGR